MKPLQLVDSEYTAHDVASVMKSILNDLPQPILCEASINETIYLGVDIENYSTFSIN